MPYGGPEVKDMDKAEELSGKLQFQALEDKLMHSVMECDQMTIDKGKLLNEAINNNISAFTPDLMMQKMVSNYKLAKKIYGPKFITAVSGYDDKYIEKNIHIPEFQREMMKKMTEKIESLKEEKLIDKKNRISDAGFELASLVSFTTEIDSLQPMGMSGKRFHKKPNVYGEKGDVRIFRKGDRFGNIATRKTIKIAARRQHESFHKDDLRVWEKESKGEIYVVYALDSSASMKGDKIDKCKKAGIALAYKAINEKDKVGLVVFGKNIIRAVPPTRDFTRILKSMERIHASNETDLALTIRRSAELFPERDVTKHLILLTDALPTKGEMPERSTLEAADTARKKGITISLVGMNLDEKGEMMAQKIVEIGDGKLYNANDDDNLNTIILEDYYSA